MTHRANKNVQQLPSAYSHELPKLHSWWRDIVRKLWQVHALEHDGKHPVIVLTQDPDCKVQLRLSLSEFHATDKYSRRVYSSAGENRLVDSNYRLGLWGKLAPVIGGEPWNTTHPELTASNDHILQKFERTKTHYVEELHVEWCNYMRSIGFTEGMFSMEEKQHPMLAPFTKLGAQHRASLAAFCTILWQM